MSALAMQAVMLVRLYFLSKIDLSRPPEVVWMISTTAIDKSSSQSQGTICAAMLNL
jgi:hypothetical protein